jgi:(R,R)-butanediol dehydrogenase/meso-butanediol dehydrogenase/diacetyl reductase
MGYVGEVCDGGFAEIVSLPAHRLLRVPANVPPEIAALAEPLGVSLRVIRRLDPARHAPIIIAGAGPIGGLAAILLEHLGFGPVAIVERNSARARLVQSVAHATLITASPADVAAFAGPGGVHFAIEATGSQAMFSFLTESLAGGGRLAMVGLFHGQPALHANAVVERELEIRGCSVFCDEQHEIMPMLPQLVDKLRPVISAAVTLENLPAEYQRLIDGRTGFLKSIVRP